jgi:hypothetical protein
MVWRAVERLSVVGEAFRVMEGVEVEMEAKDVDWV